VALDLAAKRALFDAVGEPSPRTSTDFSRRDKHAAPGCAAEDVRAQQNGVKGQGLPPRGAQRRGRGLVHLQQSGLRTGCERGKSGDLAASQVRGPGEPSADGAAAVVQCGGVLPPEVDEAGLPVGLLLGDGPIRFGPDGAALQPSAGRFAGYQLRGLWMSDRYTRLRNSAWLARHARVGQVQNPVALQVVVAECEKLSRAGEKLSDIIEALAELLMQP
jgi:hypothetical protein